jgi:hypothetical protein
VAVSLLLIPFRCSLRFFFPVISSPFRDYRTNLANIKCRVCNATFQSDIHRQCDIQIASPEQAATRKYERAYRNSSTRPCPTHVAPSQSIGSLVRWTATSLSAH